MGRLSRYCKHVVERFIVSRKKYTVNNLGLVSRNKWFLYAAGAPDSTHDARLLKPGSTYNEIIGGSIISTQKVALGNFEEIP